MEPEPIEPEHLCFIDKHTGKVTFFPLKPLRLINIEGYGRGRVLLPLHSLKQKEEEGGHDDVDGDGDDEATKFQLVRLLSEISSRTEREEPQPVEDTEMLESFDEDNIELQRDLLNFYSKGKTEIIINGEDDSKKTLDVKKKGTARSCTLDSSTFRTISSIRSYERGESSWTSCVICTDEKPTGTMIANNECDHFFCKDCITMYIAEKLQQEDIQADMKCPQSKCKEFLERRFVLQFVPEEMKDQWRSAIREASALASQRVIYCPFEHCQGMFFDDGRGFLIRACPNCWKIFCVQCRVSWHMGLNCETFQLHLRRQQRHMERWYDQFAAGFLTKHKIV
ncbi:unnamed protein product [Ilex paraguariensis]|uniref:RBR-type E3 ubiquitin transferase n=1 Tax=Ilex paraguariensis TaxID=185542 RepID=A0ABC8TWG5_9AQUA